MIEYVGLRPICNLTYFRRGSKPPAPLPPEPIYENLRPNEIHRKFEGEADKPALYKKRAAPKPTGPTFERPSSLKKKPAPQPSLPRKFESNVALNGSDIVKPKLNPVKEMELMSGRNKNVEVCYECMLRVTGNDRQLNFNNIFRVTTKLHLTSKVCCGKLNTIERQ